MFRVIYLWWLLLYVEIVNPIPIKETKNSNSEASCASSTNACNDRKIALVHANRWDPSKGLQLHGFWGDVADPTHKFTQNVVVKADDKMGVSELQISALLKSEFVKKATFWSTLWGSDFYGNVDQWDSWAHEIYKHATDFNRLRASCYAQIQSKEKGKRGLSSSLAEGEGLCETTESVSESSTSTSTSSSKSITENEESTREPKATADNSEAIEIHPTAGTAAKISIYNPEKTIASNDILESLKSEQSMLIYSNEISTTVHQITISSTLAQKLTPNVEAIPATTSEPKVFISETTSLPKIIPTETTHIIMTNAEVATPIEEPHETIRWGRFPRVKRANVVNKKTVITSQINDYASLISKFYNDGTLISPESITSKGVHGMYIPFYLAQQGGDLGGASNIDIGCYYGNPKKGISISGINIVNEVDVYYQMTYGANILDGKYGPVSHVANHLTNNKNKCITASCVCFPTTKMAVGKKGASTTLVGCTAIHAKCKGIYTTI